MLVKLKQLLDTKVIKCFGAVGQVIFGKYVFLIKSCESSKLLKFMRKITLDDELGYFDN